MKRKIIIAIFLFCVLSLSFVPVVFGSDTLFEYYAPTMNDGWGVRGTRWRAQTFTVGSVAHSITSVKLELMRVGSPDGSFYVYLWSVDGSGHPTGSNLSVGSIVASTISDADYAWYEFSMSVYNVSVGVKYALVFSLPLGDVSNRVAVATFDSGGYSGGNEELSDNSGVSWSSEAYDCLFYVYGESWNSAPTNDACDSDAAFNVGANGWVNMTVSDTDLVANLNTVSILVTTADAKTIRLNWTQATNTFSEITDASGICTLSGSSTRVNVDSDTDKIAFYFAINALAQKGPCSVTAQTIDDSGASDSDTYSSEFTINAYSSLTIQSGNTTHSWTAEPNTNDNLITESSIYFNITTNFAFDIQAKANQTALNGTSGSISIGNVTIHKDTLGSSIPLTTSYADVGGLTAQSMGVNVQLSVKVWLDVPNATPKDSYSYSLNIQVTEA